MLPATIVQCLHQTLHLWETALGHYNLEQLCRKPDAKSWSVGQVYMHLLDQTISYNFLQIEQCISSNENMYGEKSEEGVVVFANNAFPDKKLTGPPDAKDPGQPESIEQLEKIWKDMRSKLALLEEKISVTKYKGKAKHPGLYYLDAWEWIQFIDIHFRHHLRQKERIDRYLLEG